MSEKRIAVGSDHAGLAMKYELVAALSSWGWRADDLGPAPLAEGPPAISLDAETGTLKMTTSVDYPDFAARVGGKVAAGDYALGLLICGSGIGISIAANKIAGVRAALCHEPYSAQMARAHNDANVLCIGGRVIGVELAKAVTRAFLAGVFEGGRHRRRVEKIIALEQPGPKA